MPSSVAESISETETDGGRDGDRGSVPDASVLRKAARGRRRSAWDSVSMIGNSDGAVVSKFSKLINYIVRWRDWRNQGQPKRALAFPTYKRGRDPDGIPDPAKFRIFNFHSTTETLSLRNNHNG
jgi:hypothetical protein